MELLEFIQWPKLRLAGLDSELIKWIVKAGTIIERQAGLLRIMADSIEMSSMYYIPPFMMPKLKQLEGIINIKSP